MKLNNQIICLFIISSTFEIVILLLIFFEEVYLSLFAIIKITILGVNLLFMAIFYFASLDINNVEKAKQSQSKKRLIINNYKKSISNFIIIVSDFLIFIVEFIYIHKLNNPYITLLKCGVLVSKSFIIRRNVISLKKGILFVLCSLCLSVEMIIFSDRMQISIKDVIIIIMCYLTITFNLFSYQIVNYKRESTNKRKKIKLFSKALFEEFFLNNGRPIFILKNEKNSIKLEMINQTAKSIFDLENTMYVDFDSLNHSFQSKFSGFSSYSNFPLLWLNSDSIKETKEDKNLMESEKIKNTDQYLLDFSSSKREDDNFKKHIDMNININELINKFRSEKKAKKFEFLLKNDNEFSNNYKFEILKVKAFNIVYFIFLIQDQSKIEEIKNLKNINELNNRLLCSLSHEIKTPINGALPNLEILKQNIEDEELLELLDISIGSLKLLENSLENIMAFNLLQTNQIFLNKNTFFLKDLVMEITDIVLPMIRIKNLNFYIEIEDIDRIKITADYTKLKQILLNLLTNALQFTLTGDIFLKIDDSEEKEIKFWVRDTGIGMEFETLNKLRKKIKEPNQGNVEINSSGSCMGLVISEKLSILLGNEVGLQIESTPNEGSQFFFSIINDDKYFEICNDEKVTEKRQTHKIQTYKSNSKSNSSSKNSFLVISSIIEEKKQNNLIEQRQKRTSHIIDDPESKTIKTGTYISTKNLIEEKTREKYNFGSLIKLLDYLDDPRQKLNHQIRTDPIIKKHVFEIQNPLSVTYGMTEKDIAIKSSPSTFSNGRKSTKKYELSCVDSDSSLAVNGQIRTKTACECEEILYADDNAFNLLSLELMLKSFHLRCCKVMNGLEAILALERKKCQNNSCKGFRLIFMDYQMPIMDGIEATSKIMEMIRLNKIHEIPIIGCTAFISKDEILKCYEVGMKDVIFKPVNINLVKNIIKEWLT